jgi:hypothetical protein
VRRVRGERVRNERKRIGASLLSGNDASDFFGVSSMAGTVVGWMVVSQGACRDRIMSTAAGVIPTSWTSRNNPAYAEVIHP